MNEHKLLFSTLHRLELSDKKDKNALDDKTIDELILDGIVIAYFNNNRFLLFINDIKISHTQLQIPINTTEFHPELFRPPLT